MTVGELVFPEVMVGMIDASTTRRCSTPCTRKRASTTARESVNGPILQVPTGWKMVVPISPAKRASWSSVWYRSSGRLTPIQTAEQIAELVLAMVQAKLIRRKRARTAANEVV